jgi:PIN domain nuclease of toxin-antitoxin system
VNLLLDTSVFLWFILGDARRLDASLIEALRDPDSRVSLSVVSVWELIVKQQTGRLKLPRPAWEFVSAERERHGIESLPLEERALAHLPKLPAVHRDPFDRMLICQAIEHDLMLVTADEAVRQYPVKTLPAAHN